MSMNESNETVYTAGLFDGEGSVTLTKGYKTSKFRTPVASLSSTTPELVEFLKTRYGGSVRKVKTYKKHHKPAYSWSVSWNTALHFLARIHPYVKVPQKKERIELLLTVYPRVTKRNGKYTEKEKASKLEFERRFFEL